MKSGRLCPHPHPKQVVRSNSIGDRGCEQKMTEKRVGAGLCSARDAKPSAVNDLPQMGIAFEANLRYNTVRIIRHRRQLRIDAGVCLLCLSVCNERGNY